MKDITCIEDLRELHRRKTPKAFFDYVDHGSYSEQTLRANRADLEAIKFRQRILVDISVRDQKTKILGEDATMPLILAPVGSTGMHIRFVADAMALQLGPEPSGYTMPFPVPGSVTRMQSNMAATLNIDWVVDRAREAAELLGHPFDRKTTLATLDARVLDGRPVATLYHPYIHEAGERGPFIDAAARAQFVGLSTRTRFIDLVRSVYEGLGLAARDCYAAMGLVPEEVRVAGGGARSKALKTILASMLGAPVRESARQEAGAAGAAMMAAVAVGIFPDLAAATGRWVTPLLGDVVRPVPELQRLYDRHLPLYIATRTCMTPIWGELAGLRSGDSP